MTIENAEIKQTGKYTMAPAELVTTIARAIGARNRCLDAVPAGSMDDAADKWTRLLETITDAELPSGSGVDNGSSIDDSSTGQRLVFNTSYHHMNDGGMYDGWTDHRVIVTADLELGYKIKITGRDRNDIKDYLAEMWSEVLGRVI